MTILAFPTPYTPFRGFANDGTPLSGGLLWSYAAGTNTQLVTYQDPGMASPNPNPTVLNARGEAPVFLPPNVAYKFLLTDSLGNTIPGWPIDNLENSQLITLYGGVDTGSANAYILTFNASFSVLSNGIVIYWVPANNNTGASTIAVNGLGVIALVNPDGSALSSGQITAGEPIQMMYYNGNWILLNGTFVAGALVVAGNLTVDGNTALGTSSTHAITGYGAVAAAQVDMSVDASSFTATFTNGFVSNPTVTMNWRRVGGVVWLWCNLGVTGTDDSTGADPIITGIPAAIVPSTTRVVSGSVGQSGTSYFPVTAIVTSSISLTLYTAVQTTPFRVIQTSTKWTVSALKGIPAGWAISYPL
jgi:hypothetical protein